VGKILSQIDHIIVVMLENRSLDNLCGWLYADTTPGHFIPQGSNPSFDGVNAGLWNPSNSLPLSYLQATTRSSAGNSGCQILSIHPSGIRSFPGTLFLFLLTLVMLR